MNNKKGWVTCRLQRNGNSNYLIVPKAILDLYGWGDGTDLLAPYHLFEPMPQGLPPVEKRITLKAVGGSIGFLVESKIVDLYNWESGMDILVPISFFKE